MNYAIRRSILLAFVVLGGPALAQDQARAAEDLNSLSQDPAQWVMPAKNYASTRFSELDQINTQNVDQLELVWSFSNGVNRGQESIPLVVGNTMYIVGPFPNNLFALNATTGDLKWTYSPPTTQAAQGVACCDVVNRGAAYSNGKIFFNTLDNHTVAVDAETGKEIWHTKLDDISTGSTMTMAPLVVKGKVLVGNSGGELGVRGWLTALDENSGEIVWRAYSTGTDEEVLIGDEFEPPYDWMNGEDLGVKTWPPERWKTGGGTVWGWISYDPELDLIFYGTGNPGPWNPNQREGDNLWTSTIFARDPDTGMAKWAYQTTPHDLWDHDAINELVLLDLEIDGQMRKTLVRPGRNGYMYVLDRTSGRLISAEPFETVTAYLGIDFETGRIIPNEEKKPELGKVIEDVCPAPPGAKDWQPSAWSSRTKLLYVPHQHLCTNFKSSEVGYIAGTPYLGATVDMYAGPGDGYRGEFMAWDPVKQEKVWAIHENFPVWSGTVVTAGDIAFYGTMDRWFKAVNARTGELLWQFRAPSGFIGQPSTYRGEDGRQYVAILSGVGGWPGVVANYELDPQVRNGALGFVGAMQDLPAYTKGGSTLLVFALPDSSGTANAAHEETPAGVVPAKNVDQVIENPETISGDIDDPAAVEDPAPVAPPEEPPLEGAVTTTVPIQPVEPPASDEASPIVEDAAADEDSAPALTRENAATGGTTNAEPIPAQKSPVAPAPVEGIAPAELPESSAADADEPAAPIGEEPALAPTVSPPADGPAASEGAADLEDSDAPAD